MPGRPAAPPLRPEVGLKGMVGKVHREGRQWEGAIDLRQKRWFAVLRTGGRPIKGLHVAKTPVKTSWVLEGFLTHAVVERHHGDTMQRCRAAIPDAVAYQNTGSGVMTSSGMRAWCVFLITTRMAWNPCSRTKPRISGASS